MRGRIKMIYYAVIVIAVLFYIIQLFTGDATSASGFGLNFSYVLSFVAIAGALVSSVLFVTHNPKGAKKLLIGIGALAVFCILAYAMSSGELGPDYAKYDVTTVAKSKLIDMGMYLTLFLGVGSVVLAVVTEAASLFKN